MRTVAGLIVVSIMVTAAAAGPAPTAAPGYEIDVVNRPGAVFAGLSRDGMAIVVTNLADGRLYRWTPRGGFAVFGPVFPHGLDVLGDPTGPYRAVPFHNGYVVTQGWTPADQDEGPLDHALIVLDDAGRTSLLSADFWNPYDFVPDGELLYVVDAARNSIERLNADGSGKTTVARFTRLSAGEEALKRLSPTEFDGDERYEFDAVPTGITHHDGRLYVSLFGGFPFIAGSGRVVSLAPGDNPPFVRLDLAGLNAPVDVAFDSNGDMLIVEHGTYDPAGTWLAGSGRVLKVDKTTGERLVLVDGLTRPTSILVFHSGLTVLSELDESLMFIKRMPDRQSPAAK